MIELIRWIKLILVDNLVPTINLFSLEYTIARLNINCCKSFYHSQSVAKYCCIFNWLQFGLKLCCLFYSKLIGCTDQDVLLSRCFELWGTVRNVLLSIWIEPDRLQSCQLILIFLRHCYFSSQKLFLTQNGFTICSTFF